MLVKSTFTPTIRDTYARIRKRVYKKKRACTNPAARHVSRAARWIPSYGGGGGGGGREGGREGRRSSPPPLVVLDGGWTEVFEVKAPPGAVTRSDTVIASRYNYAPACVIIADLRAVRQVILF